MRNDLIKTLWVIVGITFVLLFMLAIFADFTLRNFFASVLAPFMPIMSFTVQQTRQNKKAISSLRETMGLSEKMWNDVLGGRDSKQDLNDFSRKLQDRIYTNRKNNPLVFDWFYNRRRGKYETTMNISAEQMVNEYHAQKSAEMNG